MTDTLTQVRMDAVNIAVMSSERIARLEGDLLEVRDYLENQMDVIDGPDGKPLPNRAMQLVNMIDETLHGPGAS